MFYGKTRNGEKIPREKYNILTISRILKAQIKATIEHVVIKKQITN